MTSLPAASTHRRTAWLPRLRLRPLQAAYWAVQLGGWGWHFFWQATGEAIFASVPLGSSATVWAGICLTELAATDLLRRISQRHAWLERPTPALLMRLGLGVVALTALAGTATVVLSLAVYGNPVPAMLQAFYRRLPLPMQLFNEFLNAFLTCLTWVAAYFGAALVLRRHRLELQQAQLKESLQAAELQLLKSQLNPHYLFNALNGVRALIADEPAQAQEAVTRLARTLRYTLDSGGEERVTLAREVEMVDDYLALESLRLAQRLQVVREIDSRAAGVRVPVMLLLALVENAIKHGIAPLRAGGTLRIAARLMEGDLVLEVDNPRPPQTGNPPSPGVGLPNTARRLALLYGPRASIRLDLTRPDRAHACVRLPA